MLENEMPESKEVDLVTYTRKDLYFSFKEREIPCVSTTSFLDVANVLAYKDKYNCKFFLLISFLISETINSIPEFRHRIIEGKLFEFERIDPGYTILLKDETFSFCDSKHFPSFQDFYLFSKERIDQVENKPDQNNGNKDHMFFITSVPWINFTSITHPYSKQYGSIPVITIGKYTKQENSSKVNIPIGIQANHALVDGIHIGKFYKILQDKFTNVENIEYL